MKSRFLVLLLLPLCSGAPLDVIGEHDHVGDDQDGHALDHEGEWMERLRLMFETIDINRDGLMDAKELIGVCLENNIDIEETEAEETVTLPDKTVGLTMDMFIELLAHQADLLNRQGRLGLPFQQWKRKVLQTVLKPFNSQTGAPGGFAGVHKAKSGTKGSAGVQKPNSGCSEGELYENDCYFQVSTSLTFHEAQLDCASRNGSLVSINNPQANNFIANLAGGGKVKAWIGATDEETEGVWKWPNGDALEFTSWAKGQPNNYKGHQNCAATNHKGAGRWDDVDCETRRPYICKGQGVTKTIDGGWTRWERTCTNPSPQYGGKPCVGHPYLPCNENIDCGCGSEPRSACGDGRIYGSMREALDSGVCTEICTAYKMTGRSTCQC